MSSRGHFSGKTAWITGASSGIGEALVYELAGRGARLIISSNDPEGLQRVRKACGDNQERVTCVPFDLSDSQGIKEIAETHVEEAGGIDFLFRRNKPEGKN